MYHVKFVDLMFLHRVAQTYHEETAARHDVIRKPTNTMQWLKVKLIQPEVIQIKQWKQARMMIRLMSSGLGLSRPDSD